MKDERDGSDKLAHFMRTPGVRLIFNSSPKLLTGHALHASKNAFNYIERAHFVSKSYPALAFFCVTHALEEAAVACVDAARTGGYGEYIKKFRPDIHAFKSVVIYFAQEMGNLATSIPISLAYSDEEKRIAIKDPRHDPPLGAWLDVDIFSLPEVEGRLNDEVSSDPNAVFDYLKELTNYRNRALYSSELGVPSITRDSLEAQMLVSAKLCVGLIWFATEIAHKPGRPFVQKVLTDTNDLLKKVDREKGKWHMR